MSRAKRQTKKKRVSSDEEDDDFYDDDEDDVKMSKRTREEDSFGEGIGEQALNKKKTRQTLEVDDDLPAPLLQKEAAGTLSTAESKELKRLRRVLKNRLAAQQFRKRQKEHLEELERAAVVEEQRRDTTMERIRSLKEKNERLRLEIRKSLDSIVLEKGASLM